MSQKEKIQLCAARLFIIAGSRVLGENDIGYYAAKSMAFSISRPCNVGEMDYAEFCFNKALKNLKNVIRQNISYKFSQNTSVSRI